MLKRQVSKPRYHTWSVCHDNAVQFELDRTAMVTYSLTVIRCTEWSLNVVTRIVMVHYCSGDMYRNAPLAFNSYRTLLHRDGLLP